MKTNKRLAPLLSTKKMDKVPVINMSASCYEQSIQLVYNAGADFYVQKPDRFMALVRIIEICLRQQGQYPDKSSKEDFFRKI